MLSSGQIENKTDEEIVPLVLQDQDNFLYLMKRYEERLLRYIRRISGLDKEDAEDVLQEVFIKIYENLNGFDTSLKFSSWAYRIAHNQVISNYRKIKARPLTVSFDDDPFIANKVSSSHDLIKELDRELDSISIKNILSKIDVKYREVLVLKFIEEKDYSEISDILQKPIGTVGALINRGKVQFKKIAEQEKIKF